MRQLVIILSLFYFTQFANTQSKAVDYVLPQMGTQSNYNLSTGNLYPYIARPWGMNAWTPQMNKMGDGWTYAYGGIYPEGKFEQKIRGFKQTHQPSPWINDYGQFSLMPTVGKRSVNENERASWFSHKAETAKPYYYSVYLADYDVLTEMSPTERACIFRITYPQTQEAQLVIDAFDQGSYIKVIPEENKILGYSTKNSSGVPQNFKCYFVIECSKEFAMAEIFNKQQVLSGNKELQAEHVAALLTFSTQAKEQIEVRVASSFISFEQAQLSLDREIGRSSFDQVAAEGREVWSQALDKVQVEAESIDQYRTFYTCLYRSLLFPRKFYEINAAGEIVHYSPYNGQVLPGYLYTDTGFWDTFRSLFPLLNLLYPTVNKEIQEGLVNTYLESGFYPEWASPGHRGCMVGNNSASVLADALLQGVEVKDTETLWKGLVKGANSVHPEVSSTGRLGYEYYNQLGYVPNDVGIHESAARTLEYAYNDWCIYQVGKRLQKPQREIEPFAKRSYNYKHLFLPESKLMCGKKTNGEFALPFNPFKWGGDFTEGNSLHYTWSVFHDVAGLIDLMGGKQSFNQMLDTVFSLPPVFDDSYYGFPIHEIREMQIMNMGQYAHGNQPIQHMAYLYNYSGQAWKSQYWIREIMNRLYTPTPDGYCGDEDNGQTSAWYVFSALGFYPVCPGSNQYVMGSPLVQSAKLQLENGNTIKITAPNNTKETPYIQQVRYNNKEYTKTYFTIDELKKGAHIHFQMAKRHNPQRGVQTTDKPYSFSTHKQ